MGDAVKRCLFFLLWVLRHQKRATLLRRPTVIGNRFDYVWRKIENCDKKRQIEGIRHNFKSYIQSHHSIARGKKNVLPQKRDMFKKAKLWYHLRIMKKDFAHQNSIKFTFCQSCPFFIFVCFVEVQWYLQCCTNIGKTHYFFYKWLMIFVIGRWVTEKAPWKLKKKSYLVSSE